MRFSMNAWHLLLSYFVQNWRQTEWALSEVTTNARSHTLSLHHSMHFSTFPQNDEDRLSLSFATTKNTYIFCVAKIWVDNEYKCIRKCGPSSTYSQITFNVIHQKRNREREKEILWNWFELVNGVVLVLYRNKKWSKIR